MLRLSEPTFESWNPKGNEKQIAVLMSGGVDSSVAAMLLKDAGWEVLGITMKIPLAEDVNNPGLCCGTGVMFVCRDLDIPHYFLDVEDSFEQLIIKPFREAYAQGRTPSPCVDCNALLKFGLVWDFLEENFGIKCLATGHYARVVGESGRYYLARTADVGRDQSYFLSAVDSRRLEHLFFPLGELSKQQVRELAESKGLKIAQRPDSMELCFAGAGDYRAALDSEAKPIPGAILDTEGNVLGEHDGIVNYTIGQRRGLGVAAGQPRYVVRICPKENSVTLGTREQAYRRDVRARDLSVFIPEKLKAGEQLLGQIRSPGQAAACSVVKAGPAGIEVEFAQAQFGPCSGQRLVLYDDRGYVVAGGTIDYTESTHPFGQT